MRPIIKQWRSWKKNNLTERKELSYKGIVPGLQPSDPNIGKPYTEIAKTEFDNWLKMGNPRHGDRRGLWRQPIAKYWASIKKGFSYFVPQTLAEVGSERQWYGKGKKNPMWSAAFIQYCMTAAGDEPWDRVCGSATERKGTISNHSWYWSGMFDNSLKLQIGEEIQPDDWVFVPLTPDDQNARKNRSDKLSFTGQDIGYNTAQPGDLILVVTKRANGSSGYHGDIMTSSGPIGGNTTRSGGRVGSSVQTPKVALTKDLQVKKAIRELLSTSKEEEVEK